MWVETRGHTFQMGRRHSCKQAFTKSSSQLLKGLWCCFVFETSVVIWKWFSLFWFGGKMIRNITNRIQRMKVVMAMNSRPLAPPWPKPQPHVNHPRARWRQGRTKCPHFQKISTFQKCLHFPKCPLFTKCPPFLILSSQSQHFVMLLSFFL